MVSIQCTAFGSWRSALVYSSWCSTVGVQQLARSWHSVVSGQHSVVGVQQLAYSSWHSVVSG